ncbi:hypothetical protein JCM12294_47110 [Desulfocicer niacini]
MMCAPFLASPVGWVILGVGGYALYKIGKNKGEKKANSAPSAQTEVPEVKTKDAGK